MISEQEFQSAELRQETELRLRKVVEILQGTDADAIIVADNANIFYLSGRFFRGYVYIDREGRRIFFVIRPDVFRPREDIEVIRKPEQIPALLSKRGILAPARLGLEEDSLLYNEVKRLAAAWLDAEITNASPILRQARMVKTPYEIEMMREDGIHQMAAYHKFPKLYKEDMTDLEMQIEMERVLRLEGSLGFLRTSGRLMEINMGSVISGDNADAPSPYDFSMGGTGVSASLPVGADGVTMKRGTAVMVDMNGNFNGYQTDMTRVWTIGEISELAMRAHDCSLRILRTLEKEGLPGVEVCRLYEIAEEIAAEEKLSDYFMGHNQKAGFIGHGVGIELNEQPPITSKNRLRLQAGMTIALEPKFVIPTVGAVGAENTYVVRETGLENLTPFPEKLSSLI